MIQTIPLPTFHYGIARHAALDYEDARCCFVFSDDSRCLETATWDLEYGSAPDDATLSCDRHVGALLGDSPLSDIVRIAEPVVDFIEVVIDHDPTAGHQVGVSVEGRYASFRPRPLVSDLIKVTHPELGQIRVVIPIRGGGIIG